MRPELMVAGIHDLHDARYCAAVGIDRIVLRIGDGTNGTLSAASISEISGWITGSAVVLDLREAPEVILSALASDFLGYSWLVSPMVYQRLHPLFQPVSFILDATGMPGSVGTLPESESPVEWIIASHEAHMLEAFEAGHQVYIEGTPDELLALGNDARYRRWYLGTSFVAEGLFDYQACDLFLEQLSVQA